MRNLIRGKFLSSKELSSFSKGTFTTLEKAKMVKFPGQIPIARKDVKMTDELRAGGNLGKKYKNLASVRSGGTFPNFYILFGNMLMVRIVQHVSLRCSFSFTHRCPRE